MFKPIKKLGQNFLKDKHAILEMIQALEMKDGETLVEIGPGLGALTTELINFYANSPINIKAIELDIRFVDKLNNMFKEISNFEVIGGNILDWLPQYKGDNTKILGSLPYYITSPIVHEIIKMENPPEVAVLLIQKEVAEKISADAPDSSYMSCFVQTFYEVEYMRTIDKKEFSPVPKVDGGVIKLTRRKQQKIKDIKAYQGFLHLAYSNPRKMLNKMFKEDERNRASIDGEKRAQNYNWEKWVEAYTILR
ncbi:ribosomal RNA small subunit methyltransferase A [candidate division WWE3 bacterium]|jgi:16S rRNA (adenine1518-N6/adenine1519-N6)-dimethyltransferase|nr:ribosomal RNA small subunit methyltransferase A [candidate division WWE3 bacterium]MBT7350337.1 ribosomal RNA small subunit methyltransferase A [candidate division WWE3 bacterium]